MGPTKLLRRMTIFDGPNGVVRYQWIPSDWDAGNLVVAAINGIHGGTGTKDLLVTAIF